MVVVKRALGSSSFCTDHSKVVCLWFVRLFDLCLFGFVCFLFLLVSGRGCGLWLWPSLAFLLPFLSMEVPLWSCVDGYNCGDCFVSLYIISLFILQRDFASWLYHFLVIFTYIIIMLSILNDWYPTECCCAIHGSLQSFNYERSLTSI